MTERRMAKQARAQETIEVILTAAADVIAKQGYGRASTNKIAKRAGVSVGSLYQYFTNKDEIFKRLLDREGRAMINELQAARYMATDDATIPIYQFIMIGSGNNNLLFKIFHALVNEPQFVVPLTQIISKSTQEVALLISGLRPDLPHDRAEQMATIIITCAEGIGREMRADARPLLIREFQLMVTRYLTSEP